MVSRIGRISLLGLVALALVPAVPANNIYNSNPDSFFDSGFELFYAGPQWLLNALPGSVSDRVAHARVARVPFDRDGDRLESLYRYSNDVGTLASPFNLALFNNVILFATSGGIAKTTSPFQADATPPDYYWDTNAALAGLGGTGTWDTTTPNWNDSTGTGLPVMWVDGNNAIFSDVPGTVTISSTVTARSLQFTVGGYSITGGTLTLTSAGSGGAGPATVEVQTGTASIASKISGTAGLTKSGAGTLTLSSTTSDFTGGVVINGGTLSVATNSNLGNTNNTVTINDTGVFNNTGSFASTTRNFVLTAAAGATATFKTDNTLSWSSASASRLTGGSSTLTIVKSGAGTFTISNSTAAYLGNWRIDQGVLATSNDAALGNSNNDVTLNGGTFNYTSATDYSVPSTRVFTLNNNAGNTIGVTDSGGTATMTFSNTNQLTGAGGFTKSGPSRLSISAPQDYQGTTTLTGGTLLVSNTSGSATGTGPVNFNNPSGTPVTLASGVGTTGAISGLVTTKNIDSNITPGGAGTVGAMTLSGGLNASAGATFHFDLGANTAGSFDVITLGAGTFTGPTAANSGLLKIDFTALTGVQANTSYQIFTYGGQLNLDSGDFSVINSAGFGGAVFTITGSEVDVTFTAVPEPSTWIGAALALGAIGLTQRKKLRGLLAQRA
jgi:fibronectin-binding autotransporter adhesin